MFEFPSVIQIPLAEAVDVVVHWLLIHWAIFFDAISSAVLYVLVNLERFFLWLPWFVVVGLVGAAAWWSIRRWWGIVLLAGSLIVIGSFGYWEQAMQTLSIIVVAVIISLAVGIPTGILMARSDRVESIIRPVLDAMQTMPSFVYLVPALMFFGLGKVPAVFATVIYAMPPVIRLTNVGIRQVSKDVVEAARAFGSSWRQVLLEVQLPLAVPSIMVGINQTTMMALAMVVIASMIGARGLGLEVLISINRIEVGRGAEAGLSIVLIAIIIDRISHAIASRQDYTAKTKAS